MTPDRKAIGRAWMATQFDRLHLRNRADVQRRQNALWRMLQPVLARTPALAPYAGRPLDEFPISTPAQVRAAFADWNTLGLDETSAMAAAQAAEEGRDGSLPDGVSAGFSTGSSGSRGLFLASPAERAAYVGHALARLLPLNAPLRTWRIALCLRADSALYRDVGGAGRVQFDFIGLNTPADQRMVRLKVFQPHVLIAPSHLLADIARRIGQDARWPLRRLFYGAEPMGEGERDWIVQRLGLRPDPIYQATEGFLGATCQYGTLHLNEDVLIIERDPIPGTNRFRPIVTDLRRISQPVVRLRLDDLLEPAEPCRCGSQFMAVRGVEGRYEDLWRWGDHVIPPRDVEGVLVGALGPQQDWRTTASAKSVTVEVDPAMASVAVEALDGLLANVENGPEIIVAQPPVWDQPKRRRIRWSDAQ